MAVPSSWLKAESDGWEDICVEVKQSSKINCFAPEAVTLSFRISFLHCRTDQPPVGVTVGQESVVVFDKQIPRLSPG